MRITEFQPETGNETIALCEKCLDDHLMMITQMRTNR